MITRLRGRRAHDTHHEPGSLLQPGLLQPLQLHMLELLPALALAALRQTCNAMRFLVDFSTGSMWLDIARDLNKAEELLPEHAVHSPAVIALLYQQAAILSNIRQGRSTSS